MNRSLHRNSNTHWDGVRAGGPPEAWLRVRLHGPFELLEVSLTPSACSLYAPITWVVGFSISPTLAFLPGRSWRASFLPKTTVQIHSSILLPI